MVKHSKLRSYLPDVLPDILPIVNPPPEWSALLGNQFVLKETGKGLSTNDYTDAEKSKLAQLQADGYVHPSTHPAAMITEDDTRKFITLIEKNNIHAAGSDNQDLSGLVSTNDSRLSDARIPLTHSHPENEPANVNIQTHVTSIHAPSNAQKNSDITKAEIEAKLTGLFQHIHILAGLIHLLRNLCFLLISQPEQMLRRLRLDFHSIMRQTVSMLLIFMLLLHQRLQQRDAVL